MNASGNIRNGSGKAGSLKFLRLTVGCILLVVIMAIGSMIADLVRSVPEPAVPLVSLIETTHDEGTAEKKNSSFGAPHGDLAVIQENQEEKSERAPSQGQQDDEQISTIRDQLMRDLCPFPDIHQLPVDFQDKARKWNKEAEELASVIQEFLPTAKNMTSEEASTKLSEIYKEYPVRIELEFLDKLPDDLRQTMWGEKGFEHRYWQVRGEIKLAIWVQHENWTWAATQCARLDDWESELHYLRKDVRKRGLVVYGEIAGRYYERGVNSVKEEIFGPGNYRELRYDF